MYYVATCALMQKVEALLVQPTMTTPTTYLSNHVHVHVHVGLASPDHQAMSSTAGLACMGWSSCLPAVCCMFGIVKSYRQLVLILCMACLP